MTDPLEPGLLIGTRPFVISPAMADAHFFLTGYLRGGHDAADRGQQPPTLLAPLPWRFPNSGVFMGRSGALNVRASWLTSKPLAAGDELELRETIAEHGVRRGREQVGVQMSAISAHGEIV